MKYAYVIFIILFSLACKKKDKVNIDLPICIQKMTETTLPVEPLVRVKKQVVDGATHYWLNTEAMNYDGVEYIVNNQCDTVCSYCGECLPATCISNYKYEKWETIWEK